MGWTCGAVKGVVKLDYRSCWIQLLSLLSEAKLAAASSGMYVGRIQCFMSGFAANGLIMCGGQGWGQGWTQKMSDPAPILGFGGPAGGGILRHVKRMDAMLHVRVCIQWAELVGRSKVYSSLITEAVGSSSYPWFRRPSWRRHPQTCNKDGCNASRPSLHPMGWTCGAVKGVVKLDYGSCWIQLLSLVSDCQLAAASSDM